ncbi:ethylene-responsive transcription factor ERF008-like [Benincasa hispida]|uniref:ethylene-responsive transcription factor ERF008-like n=1 Tax=Benincasa hispida TaxID=102211 RepID=UPI001900205C|nr:ethylene-responsive transcription factor ERF008-like [Benincasa hispida]XP_038900861.1 ethylene-responsive transcription factor ERF008-like [Benincasa hispida]
MKEKNEDQKKLKQFKGIRMRKWGKWVAEIREPNKRSRIWLGSYSSPVAAARAYDAAVFHLRGPSARLNFPDFFSTVDRSFPLSAAAVRKIAAEVGARVDALESSLRHHSAHSSDRTTKLRSSSSSGFSDRVDLNKFPDPEDSDGDCATTPCTS